MTAGEDDHQRAAAPEQFMDLFQSELIGPGDHTGQLAQGERLGAALGDTEATAASLGAAHMNRRPILGAAYHCDVGAAGKQADIDRHHTPEAVSVHSLLLPALQYHRRLLTGTYVERIIFSSCK